MSAEMKARGGQERQIGSRHAVSRCVTEHVVCACVCESLTVGDCNHVDVCGTGLNISDVF